ncbi:unnamed protein product, partial [Mesorhabditis spiculigera]
MDWSDEELKQNKRIGDKRRSYSEEYLVDCSMSEWGCSGGWSRFALEYIEMFGIPRGAQYPYVSGPKRSPADCNETVNVEYPISKVEFLTGNVSRAMEFVRNKGPIIACK